VKVDPRPETGFGKALRKQNHRRLQSASVSRGQVLEAENSKMIITFPI
jgi:hypothetical protein